MLEKSRDTNLRGKIEENEVVLREGVQVREEIERLWGGSGSERFEFKRFGVGEKKLVGGEQADVEGMEKMFAGLKRKEI